MTTSARTPEPSPPAPVVLEPRETLDAPFWSTLSGAVEEADRPIIVDLAAVTRLDSAAIGLLITATRNARRRETPLVIAGLIPELREVFAVTQLDRLFTVRDTADAALRELT